MSWGEPESKTPPSLAIKGVFASVTVGTATEFWDLAIRFSSNLAR